MRKFNLSLATFLAFLIFACSAENNNDSQEKNSTKLLLKVTENNYKANLFFYNDDLSIDKIEHYVYPENPTKPQNIKYFYYENGRLDSTATKTGNNVDLKYSEKYIYTNNQLHEIHAQSHYSSGIFEYKIRLFYIDDLVHKIEYYQDDSSLLLSEQIFEYDGDDNIVKSTYIASHTNNYNDGFREYTYDDKNSPYININPMHLSTQWIGYFKFIPTKNNPTKKVTTSLFNNEVTSEENYTNIYDNDGYLISSNKFTYEYNN
ncbi:hypothetical protein [Mangrovimonas xylaniphaga]|uniref:hypothetical protein n=1 Tax=Mangrovimonas xylaniphaga TaxID=1645915 RepID=UPI0006B6339B|nr:hypothetical protein [Mangrovimonas xylaniphaga]